MYTNHELLYIDIPFQFGELELTLRSQDVHTQQCDDLEEKSGLSVEYGINSRSPLLQLQHFNMCCGSLVTDVLHDLLEGMLPYEAKNLLQHFNSVKIVKAKVLYEIMDSFEFGYMEVTNRPTPITRMTLKSNDNSLKQNGELPHL